MTAVERQTDRRRTWKTVICRVTLVWTKYVAGVRQFMPPPLTIIVGIS